MKSFGFSGKLSYFRALFPNWNFFDQIGSDFKLQFRRHSLDQEWEDFPFVFDQPTCWLSLNPQIHLKLAQKNILEHFVQDLQEWQSLETQSRRNQVEDITSFKLLKSLIEIHLEQTKVPEARFQVRILALDQQGTQELFVSGWLLEKGPGSSSVD